MDQGFGEESLVVCAVDSKDFVTDGALFRFERLYSHEIDKLFPKSNTILMPIWRFWEGVDDEVTCSDILGDNCEVFGPGRGIGDSEWEASRFKKVDIATF